MDEKVNSDAVASNASAKPRVVAVVGQYFKEYRVRALVVIAMLVAGGYLGRATVAPPEHWFSGGLRVVHLAPAKMWWQF